MSDTHLRHDFEVPDGDVLVHAGDITNSGSLNETLAAAAWLRGQPHPYKVFCPGNHDYLFEREPLVARLLFEGLTVLVDQFAEVAGLRMYGSPWQPHFMSWAFQDSDEGLGRKFGRIPDGLDVLVTHCPPYRILDDMQGKHLGSEALRERVLVAQPRLHVFGHIHYGAGAVTGKFTHFVNAAICTERYEPLNPPIVVEL